MILKYFLTLFLSLISKPKTSICFEENKKFEILISKQNIFELVKYLEKAAADLPA